VICGGGETVLVDCAGWRELRRAAGVKEEKGINTEDARGHRGHRDHREESGKPGFKAGAYRGSAERRQWTNSESRAGSAAAGDPVGDQRGEEFGAAAMAAALLDGGKGERHNIPKVRDLIP